MIETTHTRFTLVSGQAVRSVFSDPQIVHRFLAQAWPDSQQDERMLWRMEGNQILMTSIKPSPLAELLALDPVLGSRVLNGKPTVETVEFAAHQGACYRFKILASPSYCNNRHNKSFMDLANIGCWWGQRAVKHGFQALEIDVFDVAFVNAGIHKGRESLAYPVAEIQGRLLCTDVGLLERAVSHGIGREKAYGCGMLVLEILPFEGGRLELSEAKKVSVSP